MKRRTLLGITGAGVLGSGCVSSVPPLSGSSTPRAAPDTVFVDADASLLGAKGTRDAPYPSISSGLERAEPGETVHVAPGEYAELIEIRDAGEPGAPITLTGPPDAVIRSDPSVYDVVRIQASHVHVTGLTIDGLEDRDAPDRLGSYSAGQLVHVRPPKDTDSYLEDIVIAPHRIGNSQKHLVGIDRTIGAEVGPFRVIGPAGAKYLLMDLEGHNGEVVYIGTSPSNLGTDWHPWTDYDRTRNVHVHHVDNSAGHGHSELVNTKLGTRDDLVEYCTDGGGSTNIGPSPTASVRFQGHAATLRWCDLANGEGHGVEIGSGKAKRAVEGDANPSEIERRGGTGNAVYGNRFADFGAKTIALPIEGQGHDQQRLLCGNSLEGTADGDPSETCPPDVPTGHGIGHTGGGTPTDS